MTFLPAVIETPNSWTLGPRHTHTPPVTPLQHHVLNLLARPFPHRAVAVQGVVSGIAVGGIVTSSISFVSQLRATENGTGAPTAADVAPAAFMYFTASAVVIAACVAGYTALPWLPYGR